MSRTPRAGRVRSCRALIFILILAGSVRLAAHPAPFSYLDIQLTDSGLSGSLVIHALDPAHDLGVDPESLLDPQILAARADALTRLLAPRLALTADGARLQWSASRVLPLPDRSSIQILWAAAHSGVPGRLNVAAELFPYDPNHQTFVNVYEGERLVRQEVLHRGRTSVDFYTATRQGRFAVFRTFTESGIHHIAIGPDHVLFIVGLLLLGGSISRLLLIVSAFTLGHSVTLSLATLNILSPPAHLVEPAIALSIVYVGADNLLVGKEGRDMRPWVALFFGLVHGFGFASVLRETGLAGTAIGLSLFSFNLGVEIGQAVIVILVSAMLAFIRSRSARVARWITVAGSLVVIAAGGYWFVQRVF